MGIQLFEFYTTSGKKKKLQERLSKKFQLENTDNVGATVWNQKHSRINIHEYYITKTISEKQKSLVFLPVTLAADFAHQMGNEIFIAMQNNQ